MKALHTFIAAFFMLVAPLLALAQNEATTAQSSAPFISGGVGAEEMVRMEAQEQDYNFKALFVRDPGGEYLASVTLKITDNNGDIVIETVTDGPVLLAQLQPGKYMVTATTKKGETITRRVNISGNQSIAETFRFPAQ
jgi:hypothetical protein